MKLIKLIKQLVILRIIIRTFKSLMMRLTKSREISNSIDFIKYCLHSFLCKLKNQNIPKVLKTYKEANEKI